MRLKTPKVGMAAGVLLALAAMRLYHVQQMLAALLLFSIGFAVVAVMILILFLLDRGLYRTLAWAGSNTAHAAVRLHRGWAQLEQFGRKQFRHSSQPVQR